jgi:15-cis-phytoene synthase
MERTALVAAARDSIASGSKSFGMASRLFDRVTRERAWLLYAWCRACDDLADGQVMGHGRTPVDDPMDRLETIKALTEAALRGEETGVAAFDALGVVVAECAIPHELPRDLVRGFALDAVAFQPRDEGDLYRYCYHVAGVVGVMMAIIMGVRPGDEAVLDRACDLGIAFQLANIARDIGEDAAAGRCYLPEEWLAEVGIAAGHVMSLEHRDGLTMLGRRLAGRAALYEASARHGTPALPFRSAWAVLAAAGIYGDIAREVAVRGRRAWDGRVATSKAAKLGWVVKAFGQAVLRKRLWDGEASRTGLWTRSPLPLREREGAA